MDVIFIIDVNIFEDLEVEIEDEVKVKTVEVVGDVKLKVEVNEYKDVEFKVVKVVVDVKAEVEVVEDVNVKLKDVEVVEVFEDVEVDVAI